MIVKSNIITKQLEATKIETVAFDDTHSTVVTPAHIRPVPDNSTFSLDGEWLVKRYPFEDTEAESTENFDDFIPTQQPGKVFYADPEAHKEEIPDWDRVTLAHIDDKDGALLVKEVILPDNFSDGCVFLRFDAIYPAGIIYLNGKQLGAHYSGLTPVEFDVTGKVNAGGRNVVTVHLLRKHKFVKMDMVRHSMEFAGLAQSAYFYSTQQTAIKDYHLISELANCFKTGILHGTVTLDNPATGTIKVSIGDTAVCLDTRAGQATYEVKLFIENPQLWNDEYPNLYNVKIELSNGESCSYRTGFRKLDLSPEGPRLNGNFIKFRGVNHLTFHPEYGMHTPKEWLRKSLSLMKKANINAIRTHFTGPSDLVDLCDEMGFYLLQELPIDWGTNYIHDPEWVGPAMMRLEGSVRRDHHHPSVMIWSIGNENMPESAAVAAEGWNHLAIYDQFCKTLDPTRPTMFPPPGPANKIEGIFELRIGDVADIHYSFKLQKKFRETGVVQIPNSWEADMVTITREKALERGWSGCWFSSEYGIFNAVPDNMHGPYLSLIADEMAETTSGENSLEVFYKRLRDEWGNMRHDPTCLGGAYFPWLCSSSGDSWGWARYGEDANWGVVTADLLPKPQFWALRTLFAPVWFPEKVNWVAGEDVIRFEITNHYNSINLNQCTFRLQQNGGSVWMSMLRDFQDITIDCAPGQTVTAGIPIWRDAMRNALADGSAGLCRITLLDPKGFCPVTADILVLPENIQWKKDVMSIGPDAVI